MAQLPSSGGAGPTPLVWKALAYGEAEDFGSPYGRGAYALGGDGVVHLSGLLKALSVEAHALMFTLPPEARPARQQAILIGDANNVTSPTMLVVKVNGEVVISSANAGFLPSLSGITFPLDGTPL